MEYTVKPGDTLSRIARATTGDSHNWRAIATNNDISDPNRIEIGQTLTIPAGLTTAIQPSDTAAAAAGSDNAENDAPRPKKRSTLKSLTSAKTTATAGRIEINGGFYSREINRKPNEAASIVGRVAPGTHLSYVKRVQGWYKVKLDHGYGYINPQYASRVNSP